MIFKSKIKSIDVTSIFDILDLDIGAEPMILKHQIPGMLALLTRLVGDIKNTEEQMKIVKKYEDNFDQSSALLQSNNIIWTLMAPSLEHWFDENYVIVQFGIIDEYYSIPILIDRELLIENEIIDKEGNANPQRFVCPIRTKGIMVSLKNKEIVEFFKKHYDEDRLSKLNNRFSKILILGKDLNREIFKKNVIDQDPNFDVTNTKKSGSLFYSAYYWAELLIRDKDIEHTVFVFDHGNIATPELREQFVDILVYKIKYYFDKFGKDNITLGSCTFKNMRDKLNSDLDIKLNSKFN